MTNYANGDLKLKRTPVRSSNLAEVGYDKKSKILEILFRNGGIWQYYDVPAYIYKELMNAESHGRYFIYQIKGAYGYSYMGKNYWR